MAGRWFWVVLAACSTPKTDEPQPPAKGFVVPAEGGELLYRKGNTVTVKVDLHSSKQMAMGTQHLDPGSGIPMHRHEYEDEVLFVHGGEGVAIVDGNKTVVHEGATVFVPHGTWHGVESSGKAVELVWVVTPPGLEDYFRATGVHEGAPRSLTPAELDEIGRKHGTEFRH